MNIIKSLQESNLLINGISETMKSNAKEHKGRFFGMLLGILRASLLENLSTGKDTIRACESTIRVGKDF